MAESPTKTALDPLYLPGLVVLTFSTGLVDAVSYLALDRVFTGNMTGNVLFVGFGLAGDTDVPLLNNALALVAFVIGAVCSGRIVRGRTHASRFPTANLVVLTCSAVVVLAIGVWWRVVGELPRPALLITTGLLALSMGAQAVSIRAAGIADVTTVVVTTTLVNLAMQSHLAGGRGDRWPRRLGAVLAMGGGGALGAFLILWTTGADALICAAAVMGIGTIALAMARRREVEYLHAHGAEAS